MSVSCSNCSSGTTPGSYTMTTSGFSHTAFNGTFTLAQVSGTPCTFQYISGTVNITLVISGTSLNLSFSDSATADVASYSASWTATLACNISTILNKQSSTGTAPSSVTIDGTGGGGGGEPHFVGFDTSVFDYHGVPGNWYLLWDGCGMRVEALFDLEPAAARYPTFGGTTFIKEMRVIKSDQTAHYDAYGAWQPREQPESIGLVRGLPNDLQKIQGNIEGTVIVPFDCGDMAITCMSFDGWYGKKEFNFLNIGFAHMPLGAKATGILGQTLLPVSERVPNDDFLIGDRPISFQIS